MHFSAFDQLFVHKELSCDFNMAAAANHEDKQTSSKGYSKTKSIPKNASICKRLSSHIICKM